MSSDLKYLRKRRGRWLVQVAVPRDLRKRFGKANVERYLGTSSEGDAKRLRHAIVADILASFDRAREGQTIAQPPWHRADCIRGGGNFPCECPQA